MAERKCVLLVDLSDSDIVWALESTVLGQELREHMVTCLSCRQRVEDALAVAA